MTDARGPFADFFGRLWRQKPLGIASGIVILILILLAIFADALAPYPFDQLNLADRLQGSSTRHLLGTDQLGRDLLSRLLFGARISLVVGLAATTLNVMVATLIGGTSGFLGVSWTWRCSASSMPGWRSRDCCCCSRSCRSRGRVCRGHLSRPPPFPAHPLGRHLRLGGFSAWPIRRCSKSRPYSRTLTAKIASDHQDEACAMAQEMVLIMV